MGIDMTQDYTIKMRALFNKRGAIQRRDGDVSVAE